MGGLPRDEELVISPPGTLAPGEATVFAETGGERVRLGAAPAEGGTGREVQLLVRGAGARNGVPAAAVTVSAGAGDRFHVGVRLTTDGTAHLVLHPLVPEMPVPHRRGAGPGAQEIPLGVLPPIRRPDHRLSAATRSIRAPDPSRETVREAPHQATAWHDRAAPPGGRGSRAAGRHGGAHRSGGRRRGTEPGGDLP
ncbi:hypothetical protein NQP46_02345 [Streptomyces albus]|nr:hypothetical protein NQP46_02345 [Streptomyces albus]